MRKIVMRAAMAAVVLTMVVSNAYAAEWRINNDPNKKAKFASINEACASDEVQDGDVLYLDPGCLLTDQQTVTKSVTIIGTGYLLKEKPYVEAIVKGAMLLQAEGIKVVGVNCNSNIYIQAAHVTVERSTCKEMNVSSQYATIRQCYIKYSLGGNGDSAAYCTLENSIIVSTTDAGQIRGFNNIIIRNNIILYSYYNANYYCLSSLDHATICNNIVIRNYNGRNNSVINGISNSTIFNNVFSCDVATMASYPNNVCIDTHELSAVFALEGSDDELYELKTDSPAIGAASDGGDCGPSGGAYPYVLSGMPLGIPYLVSTNSPTHSKDGKIKLTQTARIQTK